METSDRLRLSAAEGWLELGNPAEAQAELNEVSPQWQQTPVVLDLRWQACAHERNWGAGLEVARTMVQLAPEEPSGWLHQAYSLRRVPEGGLQAAWKALWPALEKFPHEAIISYNLACYACQLERMDQARSLLHQAMRTGGPEHMKQMALNDPDLKPLWEEIRGL